MELHELVGNNIPLSHLKISISNDHKISISAYEIDDKEPYFVVHVDDFDPVEILKIAKAKLDPVYLAVFTDSLNRAIKEIGRRYN